MKKTNTKKLVEAALMIALGTILGVLTIAKLPYGGSVTFASMLPIIIISYRHGVKWGLGTGLAFSVVQQLTGLENLTFVPTWQAMVAVFLLDYLVAYTVTGLGGIFRDKAKNQSAALVWGALLVSVLRYICHVLSGATVWAGISIPTGAALVYSLIYNATYMIPEAVVLVAVAYYLGSTVDFAKDTPTRMVRDTTRQPLETAFAAKLIALLAFIADVALIVPHLQDPEEGTFSLSGLSVSQYIGSFWFAVTIISAVAAVMIAALVVIGYKAVDKAEKSR